MEIHLERKPAENLECDALIALTFEDQPNGRFRDSLSEMYSSGEVAGKIFEMTLVHHPAGLKAKRLLLAGGGKKEKFTSAELRRVSGAALRHLKSRSVKSIAMLLDSKYAAAEHVEAAVEGALLGDFDPDRYKSDKKDVKVVDRFTVAVPGGGAALDAGLE